MQTKLKPIFFLVTLAATAILLYAANDARAQSKPLGIFNVPVSPSVLTISPKLSHDQSEMPVDSTLQKQGYERPDALHEEN